MTEKDELLQAKERELAEAQQQLRQQVSCVYIYIYCVCMYNVLYMYINVLLSHVGYNFLL